jgi:hypothetical protein
MLLYFKFIFIRVAAQFQDLKEYIFIFASKYCVVFEHKFEHEFEHEFEI